MGMRSSRPPSRFALGVSLLLASISLASAQNLLAPSRVWSVGPVTKSEMTMGVSLGAEGASLTGPRVDSQTASTFSAVRSVVFAGDRVVLASKVGMRKVEGAQFLETLYQLVSLDALTGAVKDTRDTAAFGSLKVFATNDAHVIVSGNNVIRLTPDLKDAGSFDYQARGHRHGRVENISPDGSTLGNATSPGFELVDARTFEATTLTNMPVVDTSVSSKAVVSDSPWWFRDYPKAKSFVTLTDEKGQHLIFHGDCSGRPQFLRDDRVLTASCKIAHILDTQGNILKMRFALQLSGKHEHFVVYSVESGEPVAEVMADSPPQEQSWTAFSPDGTMVVVGSPLRLTLYRLP